MKTQITAITAILLLVPFVQVAYAESIPDWIKNNAGWWAEGAISQDDFVNGLQFLISENILKVPPTTVSAEKSQQIPDWVKNNAAWWAQGQINDGDFINGVQHLMKVGIITVPEPAQSLNESNIDSELSALETDLDACGEIKKAYQRLDCEKAVKQQIEAYEFRNNSEIYKVGPVTFYYPGLDFPGNDFEIMDSGQAILSIRILAENSGSSDNVTLMCTGPAICNYDVWDGSKAFKYSGSDFTNGQIVLKPGDARAINMLFGPNIGYGGTTFEYDSSKDYFFRISEPWGSVNIPLEIG